MRKGMKENNKQKEKKIIFLSLLKKQSEKIKNNIFFPKKN